MLDSYTICSSPAAHQYVSEQIHTADVSRGRGRPRGQTKRNVRLYQLLHPKNLELSDIIISSHQIMGYGSTIDRLIYLLYVLTGLITLVYLPSQAVPAVRHARLQQVLPARL